MEPNTEDRGREGEGEGVLVSKQYGADKELGRKEIKNFRQLLYKGVQFIRGVTKNLEKQ